MRTVRSYDGGLSWTTPAIPVGANVYKNFDSRSSNSDGFHQVIRDETGRWALVWRSTSPLTKEFGEQNLGEDGDILISFTSNRCPSMPAAGCIASDQRSKIKIKDRIERDGGADKLLWSWRGSSGTPPAAIGDPAVSGDQAFCLYEGVSGVYRLVMEMAAEAAAKCRFDTPCWKTRPGSARFSDSLNRNGAIGKLKLSARDTGKAAVKLKAKGPTVGPPRLPLGFAPDVVVQLHNTETAHCWESHYASADVNDGERFQAATD